MELPVLSPSDAVALINQTLEYAYPSIVVEGEVASFKINKNQYVFFDVKDAGATLNCFMMVYQLRVPVTDGMKVRVVASAKLTQWGKFSLTVREIIPVGQGSIKKSFDLLKEKLAREGLFDAERKRPLPTIPRRVGVISSTQAAGYADFVKILEERWKGVELLVADVQVQGVSAAGQMIRALEYLNGLAEVPDAIVLIRGGGSADDLSCFNDEPLARAIAASRAPVVVGVGHEVDTTIADLVADLRAATPSNAAQRLFPEKRVLEQAIGTAERRLVNGVQEHVVRSRQALERTTQHVIIHIDQLVGGLGARLQSAEVALKHSDPRAALRRGYAIVRDSRGGILKGVPGRDEELQIETEKVVITTKGVKDVKVKPVT